MGSELNKNRSKRASKNYCASANTQCGTLFSLFPPVLLSIFERCREFYGESIFQWVFVYIDALMWEQEWHKNRAREAKQVFFCLILSFQLQDWYLDIIRNSVWIHTSTPTTHSHSNTRREIENDIECDKICGFEYQIGSI